MHARFAILMHESAHRLLFTKKKVNDFVGTWLIAYPRSYPYLSIGAVTSLTTAKSSTRRARHAFTAATRANDATCAVACFVTPWHLGLQELHRSRGAAFRPSSRRVASSILAYK